MDFLALLKDIIAMVVVSNAVTGQKPGDLDEDYMGVLQSFLDLGDNRNNR